MELKEYAKKIILHEPIAKDNRFSYQYYRLTDDSIALVVYDHGRKEKNAISLSTQAKNKK